jgi:hypothetical protein
MADNILFFHLPVLRPRGHDGFGGERPPLRADGNSVSLVWLSNEIHTAVSPWKKQKPQQNRGLAHQKNLGEVWNLAQILFAVNITSCWR